LKCVFLRFCEQIFIEDEFIGIEVEDRGARFVPYPIKRIEGAAVGIAFCDFKELAIGRRETQIFALHGGEGKNGLDGIE
jgi:hypothetical protein